MNINSNINSAPSTTTSRHTPLTLDQLLSAGYSLAESAKRLDRSEKRRRQETRDNANKKAETLKQLLNERRESEPTIVSVSTKNDPSIAWKRSRSITTFSRRGDVVSSSSSSCSKRHGLIVDGTCAKKKSSIAKMTTNQPKSESHIGESQQKLSIHGNTGKSKKADSSSSLIPLPSQPSMKTNAPSNMGARCA